ncbi:MAG: LUD domain-containing protein [Deltaproteobacteria bacterium]|nr:LUD domain-containing protein [Deltaproteobacteria bacterium]
MSAAPTSPQTVRAAAHRALAARERLVREYPEWETWRRQARESKAQAVSRLDDLLAALQRRVEGWGGTVLQARDAAQARQHILQIARRHKVEKVVKSKSMTTEEIRLNPFLVQAGLEVTETDLGEFIIQLAGHAPAHLTAPALHLNRGQIAAIFAKHLGLDCPAEPAALCQAASLWLKSRFGEAQMGITGVNFAAAREGTLVFLENESNLRQSLALPRVHVALMGLEKVIPTLPELEPFLRLLPASATGQRLTALVHFIHGLKPHQDGDYQSFYLVLLDNGRRRLVADADMQEALYCLRCGACLNICPVFQAGGAHLYGRVYPGAIGILLARYLAPLGDISSLCTQCGACGAICPVGIDLPEKILSVRQSGTRFRGMRLLSRGAGLILARPRLYRGMDTALRRFAGDLSRRTAQNFLGAPLSRVSFHQSAGRSPARLSPLPARQTLPEEFPEEPPKVAETASLTSESRFQEAGAGLVDIQGPEALARYLAEGASGPVWLEDHHLTKPAVAGLAGLGVEARLAQDSWPSEIDTAVTVGMAAVLESGSVIVAPGSWPAAWLPFRARRHVVLIPPDQSGLTVGEALQLTAGQAPGLVTWLTGPTRTTDIEKVLVLGAQGPAELDVAVYNPET